jgi:hypothetical protein
VGAISFIKKNFRKIGRSSTAIVNVTKTSALISLVERPFGFMAIYIPFTITFESNLWVLAA